MTTFATTGTRNACSSARSGAVLTGQDRRAFAGRRVLITGAGGSIGSELARQVAACGPSRLTLVDQSEFNLFQIERELAERFPGARASIRCSPT